MRCLLLMLLLACSSAQAQTAVEQARVAFASGDFAQALELASSVEESADAQFLLWRLYAQTPLDDRGRAGRALSRAIDLDPTNVAYREAQLVHLRKRRVTRVQNEYLELRRRDLARDLLRIDSTSSVAHEEFGLVAAREFYEQFGRSTLTERRPAAGGGGEMGGSTADARRAEAAYREATARFERAIREAPEHVSGYRSLLGLYARMEAWTDALRVTRRMVRALPNSADARLWLGLAEQRLGNDRLADMAFQAGLERADADVSLGYTSPQLIAGADSLSDPALFWEQNDPLLLTDYNERQLAHYARVAFADLVYGADLLDLRGWETRRGQIFIRYGTPLYERTIAPSGADLARYAVWEYDDFQFVFHDEYRSGEFALFTPSARDIALGLVADVGEADYVMQARDMSRTMPQRYTFDPEGVRIDAAVRAAGFRGVGGATDLVVAYGMPVGSARGGMQEPPAEVGVFLGAGADRVEVRDTLGGRTAQLVRVGDAAALLLGHCSMKARPGVQRLSVELVGIVDRVTGVNRSVVDVPAFPQGRFAISDLLPAYGVEEAYGESPSHPAYVVRGDLRILPAPSEMFDRSRPLYLYFEIYDLVPAPDGMARYELEIDLTREGGGGLLSMFRSSPRGVSVRFPGEVRGRDASTYQILDVTDQEPGTYVLTLTVRDAQTGERKTRTQEIVLQ